MEKVIVCDCDQFPGMHNGMRCHEVLAAKFDASEIELQRDCPHADHVPGKPVHSLAIEGVCQACGAVVLE